jgi:threonine dehydrogenase-like Zn-dependent dehydrogenase
MRAIVSHGPRAFRIDERPVPAPAVGEVLLRPLFNGLCFTDKHLFDGHVERADGIAIGHEFSAEIVGLGDGVQDWAKGALVSVDPRLRCGDCLPCRAGLEMLCKQGRFLGVYGADGGLAGYCVVPVYCLYPLPVEVTPLQAACAEAACCATRAVRSGALVAGDNVVLLGLEDYNLYIAQWLKAQGGIVVAVDPNPLRREAALGFGATTCLDPASDDVPRALKAIMPFGADAVVVSMEDYVPEASDYVALAHRIARIQGNVIMLRAYGSAPFAQTQPGVPWLKELTIRHFGNFFGNEPARGGRARGDWQVTLDAMARGVLAAPPPQAQVVPFADLKSAGDIAALFDSLPGGASKIIVDMAA